MTISSSSEPGLRGELPAESAEGSLVDQAQERVGAQQHNKKLKASHLRLAL